MKRCPTCQRTYDDDALSFCLEDGTRLIQDESSVSSTAPTLIATFQPDSQQTAPQQMRETLPGNWNPSNQAWSNQQAYQQPSPQATPQRRSLLPWLLGGLAVLLIGGGILIFALSSRHSSTEVATTTSNANSNNANGNANRSVNGNANNSNNSNNSNNANNANANNSNNSNVYNRNANGNLNGNTNGNSNANNSNANANSNTAPTDQDAVLADLRRIEDKWNKANADGDKAALSYVLADEYKDSSGDKKQYLARLKPNTSISSQTISGLDLTLSDNKATLRGINTVRFVKGNPVRYRFTDTYIWRNGRWQATGSTSQQIK